MIELGKSDLEVLALLAKQPMQSPPPLILVVIKKLHARGLTMFAIGHWRVTPLALDIMAKHASSENEGDKY